MTEDQRQKKISPYLDPAPGKVATLSSFEIRNHNNKTDPLKVKGYVVVRPPKKSCFIIKRHPSIPDARICKEEKVYFNGYMLRADGSFEWEISTGASDPGYKYTWKTPYRVAMAIGADERPWHLYDKELVVDCKAYGEDDRRVVVTVLKNRRWAFRLPKEDIYAKPAFKYDPGEMYGKGDGGKVSESDEEGMGTLGTTRQAQKQALENMHKKEHVAKYWMMSPHGAFKAAASNFSTSDSPIGLKGECLYQYTGAYHDPKSGWLECHNSDEHDVVYIPMTCLSELAPESSNKKLAH